MSEQHAQPAPVVENVGRGVAFALLAIPAAIAIFAVLAGVFGIVSWIAAVVIPYIAGWLYTKGAGAPVGKAGRGAYIGIAGIALVLGLAVGIIGGFYRSFSRVGGDGGVLGNAFWTTVRYQLTVNVADNIFPVVLGLAIGLIGIVGVVRGRPLNSNRRRRGPGNLAQSNMPGALGGTQPDAPFPSPTAPVPPPAAAPRAPNQPSPGIILNGKPFDPDKR